MVFFFFLLPSYFHLLSNCEPGRPRRVYYISHDSTCGTAALPLLEDLYTYWTRRSRGEELSSRDVNHKDFSKDFHVCSKATTEAEREKIVMREWAWEVCNRLNGAKVFVVEGKKLLCRD